MNKFRRILIVWLAIYPVITIILYLFGEYLAALPLLFRTLILTVFLVPSMVLALIPLSTKIVNHLIVGIKKILLVTPLVDE